MSQRAEAMDEVAGILARITSVKGLAQAFCELTHSEQAEFIVEIGRIMDTWDGGGRTMQAHMVGRHLRRQDMLGYSGKEFVREVCEAFGEMT